MKRYQRMTIMGIIAASLIVVTILFVVGEHNPSVAYPAPVVALPTEAQPELAYFFSPDKLPSVEKPASVYTALFFSASWDSYSVGMSGMLKAKLATHANLQIVELDINNYRAQALALDVQQPPVVILLNKTGTELARITSATTGDLEKLLTNIPKP